STDLATIAQVFKSAGITPPQITPVSVPDPVTHTVRLTYTVKGKSTLPVIPDSRVVIPLCAFYGQANSGGAAWRKDEVCTIHDPDLLDSSYRQTQSQCCGGGATSNMTASNTPAGLEVAANGGYNWAVLNGALDGNSYKLQTYCTPGAAGQP